MLRWHSEVRCLCSCTNSETVSVIRAAHFLQEMSRMLKAAVPCKWLVVAENEEGVRMKRGSVSSHWQFPLFRYFLMAFTGQCVLPDWLMKTFVPCWSWSVLDCLTRKVYRLLLRSTQSRVGWILWSNLPEEGAVNSLIRSIDPEEGKGKG